MRIIPLILLCCPAVLFAEDLSKAPLERCLERLGDPAWARREAATGEIALRLLLAHSRRATHQRLPAALREPLARAARSKSVEQRRRASRLLSSWAEMIKDGSLRRLAGRGDIHALDLRGCAVTDAGLVHLARLPRLRTLSLGGKPRSLREAPAPEVTGEGFRHLRHLPALRRLVVTRLAVEDTGIWHISRIPGLQELELAELRSFRARFNGRGVTASSLPKITPVGLRHLAGLPALRVLRLNRLDLSDAHLSVLRKLPALEVLGLQHWDELDGSGLAHLSACPKLRELDLSGCLGLRGGWVDVVAKLDGLKELWLRGVERLTDQDLAKFARLRLTAIDVSDCPRLTARSWELLLAHPLDNLRAGGLPITDDALARVKRCPTLRLLDLYGCKRLTDAGLVHLRGLLKLEFLQLGGIPLGHPAVVKLRKALPEARVYASCCPACPE